MEDNNGSSNTNTILIVIVLVIVVALGVWWFSMKSKSADNGSLNVDVNLPTGGAAGSTVPAGSGGGSATE